MTKASPCEHHFHLSITEVTQSFGISEQTVLEIIEQGIITPREPRPKDWVFSDKEIHLIRTVLNLHHDLGVNVAGAALALELLDEIEHLKRRIR